MNNLDFLPIEYREEYERWRLQPWQIGAAAMIVSLVVGAAIFQHYRWRRAQDALAAVTPVYEKAVSLQSRLVDVQSQLRQVQASVDLHNHMRRSGQLADLLAALATAPDDVALDEVRVLRESADTPAESGTSATADKSEELKQKLISATDRDLTKLRLRVDALQTLVILGGTAGNVVSLRQYLSALEATQALENAELTRLDRVAGGDHGEAVRFRAVLTIPPSSEGDSP
jgi:hypothetical protein